MTAFNKNTMPALRLEINAALKAVAEKHGILINLGNCRFGADTATWKLEAIQFPSANATVAGVANATAANLNPIEVKAALDWKAKAAYRGLPVNALGKQTLYGGKTYTIVGLMPRRHRYPILAKSVNGKLICLAESAVRNTK